MVTQASLLFLVLAAGEPAPDACQRLLADKSSGSNLPAAVAARVDAYRGHWRSFCSAVPGPSKPTMAGLLEECRSLVHVLQESGAEWPQSPAANGSPLFLEIPGVAPPYGQFVVNVGDFIGAARYGSSEDKTFWALYQRFEWPGSLASPSLAVSRGRLEPGDDGCLLLAEVDLLAAVAAVLELESLAKAPAYKDLAGGVRRQVLGGLDLAASPGACLCSDGPNLPAQVRALSGARGRGPPWVPFADGAAKIEAAMKSSRHFNILDPATTSCGGNSPPESSRTTKP